MSGVLEQRFIVKLILNVTHAETGNVDQIRYDGLVRAESIEQVYAKLNDFKLPGDFTVAPIEEVDISQLPESIRRYCESKKVNLALAAGEVSPRQPPPCG